MTHRNEPRLHPVKRAQLVRRIQVNWQDKALCAKFPADDWFPVPGDGPAVAEADEVCLRCPVQVSCLAAALVVGEEHGIWGGTTEADRQWAWGALKRGHSVPSVLESLTGPSGTTGEDVDAGEVA